MHIVTIMRIMFINAVARTRETRTATCRGSYLYAGFLFGLFLGHYLRAFDRVSVVDNELDSEKGALYEVRALAARCLIGFGKIDFRVLEFRRVLAKCAHDYTSARSGLLTRFALVSCD